MAVEGIQEAAAEAASKAITRAGLAPAAAPVEKKRDNRQDDEEFGKEERGHPFRTSPGSPAKKKRVDHGVEPMGLDPARGWTTGPNATGAECCITAAAAIAISGAGCASSTSAAGLEH